LFPDDPIHLELLPDDVQAIIGQVGEDTRAVEKMLRRIGFEYAQQIDPFDGGPHFIANTDDITVIKDAREVEVGAADANAERKWAIVGLETPGMRPQFRAIGERVQPLENGAVGLTDDARQRLGIEVGQKVWLSYG
jgi:arginine N-succinyltransferase